MNDTQAVINTDKLLLELETQNEELKSANCVLESSCKRYRELYDFAPIGYLTLTQDGIIAEINLNGALLFGIEREQLINRRFLDFVVTEDSVRWQNNFLNARRYSRKQQCELTLLRARGEEFHGYLDYQFMEVGDSSAMLYIMLTDVSEQAELRDNDEIYRSILATTLDGFWVFNAQGKILDVNSRYSDQSGYSHNELLEMSVLDLVASDDVDDTKARIQHIMDSGSDQFESMHKRKDGTVWHVEVSITYLDCSGGRFYAFLRDITNRKQAEEETKEINAALNVLLRQRQNDKSEAQTVLSQQVEATVLPFLKKLKKPGLDGSQTRLLDVLETNLQYLVKAYGRSDTLSATYQQLTPVEIQVASMVRLGLSTKHIATALHLSANTVSIHRKHIRKKLGLDNKASNLSSYLMSLSE